MSQQFEKWLKINWRNDINRKLGEEKRDKLREDLKREIATKVAKNWEGDARCQCDTCVLIYLNETNELKTRLAHIGMQYLLGENFNGASANYYLSFLKAQE